MTPTLSLSTRIRLLRKAVDRGVVTPEEAALEGGGEDQTLDEGDLAARFDRLRSLGRIPAFFILQELERDPSSFGSRSTGSQTQPLWEGQDASGAASFPLRQETRYRPLALLGEGGMGRVFKAYDLHLQRVVALKFLRHLEPGPLERFLQEARAQAQIDHPNVCPIFAVGSEDGQPFLAMRFVDGPTLKEAAPQLSTEQKASILRQVAEALHACHRNGVIHRDIKPSNLMLERDERGSWHPFITDFGLARDRGSEGFTVTGMVVGTPVYASPEQLQGRLAEVDRRSDVYALGATLYTLLSGEPPFPTEGSLVGNIYRMVHEDPPSLRLKLPTLPADLDAIVQKAMEKDAARRYDSARAFGEDLQRYLDGEPTLARPLSTLGRLLRRVQKHRGIFITMAASAVILTLALSLLFVRARVLSRRAQQFGAQAEWMESVLFKAQCLPLHDTRYARSLVLARIEALQEELRQTGSWSGPAGPLALGRGYMALGRFEEARVELERARDLGPEDPDVAQALGVNLATLHIQGQSGLRGKALQEWRKTHDGELRQRALTCLRAALPLAREAAPYLAAQVALLEGESARAVMLAREAQRRVPWLTEACLLEGHALAEQARDLLDRGAFDRAEALILQQEAPLRRALDIARSSPTAWLAEGRRRLELFRLRQDQGRATVADRDHALEPFARALEAAPDTVLALSYQGVVHRQWAGAQLRRGEDPSASLGAAIRAFEAGLALAPNEVPLLNNLATALRNRAEWDLAHRRDARADLIRAIATLERGIQKPAYQDQVLNNLGNTLGVLAELKMHQGEDASLEWARAAECFHKAWALKPWVGHMSSLGIFLITQAACLEAKGADAAPLYREAIEAFRQALDLNPSSYQALFGAAQAHAGRALWRARHGEDPGPDLAEGLGLLERGLRQNPAKTAQPAFIRAQLLAARAIQAPEARGSALAAYRVALRKPKGDLDPMALRLATLRALSLAGIAEVRPEGLRLAREEAARCPDCPLAKELLHNLQVR